MAGSLRQRGEDTWQLRVHVGTDPINSPRLFHALNGLGKTVSMYLYPYEDHGPATHETTLDLWARWSAWLDKYVKKIPN